MTYVYSAVVQSAFSTDLDTLAIEITAPANTSVKIRKIRVFTSDGTDTTSFDHNKKIKLVLESVAGSGGSSYTPIALNANNPASVSTVNIAPVSTVFSTGTISTTIDVNSVHSDTGFYWHASDEGDKITIAPGGIFGITVNPPA